MSNVKHSTDYYKREINIIIDEVKDPGTAKYLYHFLDEFVHQLIEWDELRDRVMNKGKRHWIGLEKNREKAAHK